MVLTIVRYSRSLLRIKIDLKVQNRVKALYNISEIVPRSLGKFFLKKYLMTIRKSQKSWSIIQFTNPFRFDSDIQITFMTRRSR